MENVTYDIIGDVHGEFDALRWLMLTMGYRQDPDGIGFIPPHGHQAIFVGDLIDKGTQNLKVIACVKNMVERGHAQCILGNHEVNAVLFGTKNADGTFQREHSLHYKKQHETFLNEINFGSPEHIALLNWFKTLPLYLDLGNKTHVIHACWHPDVLEVLKEYDSIDEKTKQLTEKGWALAGDRIKSVFNPLNILIKGPIEPLIEGKEFTDSQGKVRTRARFPWWQREGRITILPTEELAENFNVHAEYDAFAKTRYTRGLQNQLRNIPDGTRIFIGHYSFQGTIAPLSDKVMCVDWGKNNQLVAYRLKPESTGFDMACVTTTRIAPKKLVAANSNIRL